MKGAETKRRLSEAFKSDKYVLQLQQKMQDIMSYTATPWNNEIPDGVKCLQEMFKDYERIWWGDLLNEKKSDLSVAMGWAIVAHHEQKLLSTKHCNTNGVLENIDTRLSLYLDYQYYWINTKNWRYTPMAILDDLRAFGYLYINHSPDPMSFTQWLYRSGYESLLTNKEFLSAIRYFDNYNEPEYIESDSMRRQKIDFELKMRMS